MSRAVNIGLSHSGGRHWIAIDFTTLQINRRDRISRLEIGDPALFAVADRNLNGEVVRVKPGESVILAVAYAEGEQKVQLP